MDYFVFLVNIYSNTAIGIICFSVYKMVTVLVCGSRKSLKARYAVVVSNILAELRYHIKDYLPNSAYPDIIPLSIDFIHGDCKNSADEFADEWCALNNVPVKSYPSTKGNYLKRNIEMVKACDIVLAFWDGFSYGTAHTIAQAVLHKKDIIVIDLDKKIKEVIL